MNFGLDIDKEKSKLKIYDLHYQQLRNTANSGYRELLRIFEGLPSNIGNIKNLEDNQFVLRFQFQGFNILIRFVKSVAKQKGQFQWYYLYFDEVIQRPKQQKIFEFNFDSKGQLYNAEGKMIDGIAFDYNFRYFVYQTLYDFCVSVDNQFWSEFHIGTVKEIDD